ncbi:uncharacterized protein LOC113280214 [Papaver somniferum]|uniref:uncharacterized protein LOC113280214 n=1 Tax=Papaver somniferum TaxID=3469 RepID=UPI000E6FDBC0|nr:uncharacterized protein LOC113280214 [Papaver somniferum]
MDMIADGVWNIQLKRNLTQQEIPQMMELFSVQGTPPILNDEEEDELQYNATGGFSVKLCYNWLIQQLPATLNEIPHSCIWIQFVPQKNQFFMWQAAQNAIPTLDNLLRRGCEIQQSTCALCSLAPESVDHLLLHCDISHKVWSYFIGGYNIRWVQGGSVSSQLQAWKFRRGRNTERKIWPLIIFAISWTLWDERNRRVMAHKRPKEAEEIISDVKYLIYIWGSHQKWFSGLSFRELITHWKTIIDSG